MEPVKETFNKEFFRKEDEFHPQLQDYKFLHSDRLVPGVVYLGHIPEGFEEDEMLSYFSQFGEVTRLKLARSKKSGRSRGHAFIEFACDEVAAIVASTMDNYLMFERILKCKVIPKEKVTSGMFTGYNVGQPLPYQNYRQQYNKPKDEERVRKLLINKRCSIKKAKQALKSVGFQFQFDFMKSKPSKKTSKIQSLSAGSTQTMEIDDSSDDEITFITPPNVNKTLKVKMTAELSNNDRDDSFQSKGRKAIENIKKHAEELAKILPIRKLGKSPKTTPITQQNKLAKFLPERISPKNTPIRQQERSFKATAESPLQKTPKMSPIMQQQKTPRNTPIQQKTPKNTPIQAKTPKMLPIVQQQVTPRNSPTQAKTPKMSPIMQQQKTPRNTPAPHQENQPKKQQLLTPSSQKRNRENKSTPAKQITPRSGSQTRNIPETMEQTPKSILKNSSPKVVSPFGFIISPRSKATSPITTRPSYKKIAHEVNGKLNGFKNTPLKAKNKLQSKSFKVRSTNTSFNVSDASTRSASKKNKRRNSIY